MLRLKWTLFRALERVAEFRGRLRRPAEDVPPPSNPAPPFDVGTESAWIFVSTIGELNAIEPFLRLFVAEVRPTPITLITDRRIYRESYRAKYPEAYVYEIDGTIADVKRLLRLTRPKLMLIAEIPCLLSDAPCRFPFAMVYEAKSRGVPVCLVNGWLYGDSPGSQLDAIECRLFYRDYVRLMDLITVQTEEVRRRMIEVGADPDRVVVTGNTKFDAVRFEQWSPKGTQSESILRSIAESGRPCVVAGCVTEYGDQVMILEAFKRILARLPNSLLVLAPRHPEKKDRMAALENVIGKYGLRYAFRTRIPDASLEPSLQCLVLNTMGELKDFYGIATVAYVGRDHNILEPLSLFKPVTISPGWEPRFPSYPVYCALVQSGAVKEVPDADGLGAIWYRLLSATRQPEAHITEVRKAIEPMRGASRRNLALLRNFGKSR